MKATFAFAAALSLLLAACSGDGGSDFLSDEPRAGDDSVIMPEESEANIIEIAKTIAAGQIPEPNEDVYFELGYYRPDEGQAKVTIFGRFLEGDQWLDKEADIFLGLNPQGKWEQIVFSGDLFGVVFELTNDERMRQEAIARQQEIDVQTQARIDELTAQKEAFEKIVISVGEPVKIPKKNPPNTGIEGIKFPVTIDNQTSQPHRVYYTLYWTQETFSASTGGCDPNFLPRQRGERDKSSEIEVPALGKTDEEILLSGFLLNICIDAAIINYHVEIEKVDGSTLDFINQSLELLQTSP